MKRLRIHLVPDIRPSETKIITSSIDKVLRDAVDGGAVPNVAAIAADAGDIIYQGAAGSKQVDGTEPVTVDTQYRIMSMTKMVTTVAALQLVEQGKINLDAPVDEYLPGFAERQVLVGFDGDTPQLRPPASRATVKHLVTHTSGLAYDFWSEAMSRWEQITGNPPGVSRVCSMPRCWPTRAPATATASTPTGWVGSSR